MPDLSISFAGIQSPNPFWLASGPPSNRGEQVARAFDHGWGGAVWKTIPHERDEIVNVSSRLAGIRGREGQLVGISNLELISDRPLAENLAEIAEIKRLYPNHPLIASVSTGARAQWIELLRQCEEAGADGFELNFSCPHGLCERGQGSAVGQDEGAIATITGWVKEATRKPVIVKLTPNVADIVPPGRAAMRAGADGLALINTIQSIAGVDLDRCVPYPIVGGRSSHGGLAGGVVKPVALQMVAALARDPQIELPISGIGGASSWCDCAEFMLLGATSVQVCTAVMLGGFGIVQEMIEGLSGWMEEKGFASCGDFIGKAVPNFVPWTELDLSYRVRARIDPERCIDCRRCVIACRDGGHQAIHPPEMGDVPAGASSSAPASSSAHAPPSPPAGADLAQRRPRVDDAKCVGCNLCSLVCPVPDCIRMEPVAGN
ncbi:MAG: NAD-dependent dihydropyrimidine dehydrogenase subunit PreA [Candidatus Eisenbacteria bacterium]|nr:NAD-dependent dihydropyrimidine dehydrogenase subunit PreA [Candidatus Eisenbacteria bacterium]